MSIKEIMIDSIGEANKEQKDLVDEYNNMKLKMTFFKGDNESFCKELKMKEQDVWDNVSLDDWDYALIVDGKVEKDEYGEVDWELQKLLQGCYDNIWHYIKEIDKTIGLAYHS